MVTSPLPVPALAIGCGRLMLLALGLVSLMLLGRLAVTVSAQWRRWSRSASERLSRLAAARLQPWPVLVVLTAGSLLTLAQRRSGTDMPPHLPSGLDVALSALLHNGLTVLAVAASLRLSELSWRDLLGPDRVPARQAITAGLRGGIMVLAPVWLLSQAGLAVLQALGLPPEPQEAFLWLSDVRFGSLQRILLAATAMVAAPMMEELVFRGLLLPVLSRNGQKPFCGIVLSSLLFAVLHQHAGALLPLLGIGIGCSVGYLVTGSLLTPIVMHAMFNAISLLAFHVAGG
jgi:membrane protease YdiL (CAAX protease family)